MSKKNIIIAIIAIIAVGGCMFYAGMRYEKSKLKLPGMFRNGGPDFSGNNKPSGLNNRNNGMQGGFADGEIISKDDKSITIKIKDGSSKIIYFSDSTVIGKATQGSITDLEVGQQIMINGEKNSDGSLAAKNIQIRPVQ